MEQKNQKVSRQKFLTWGLAISSFLALPVFLRPSKKKADKKTAKMLTQDGQLVEIDLDRIPAKKQKIKAADIHTWVKRKTSSL